MSFGFKYGLPLDADIVMDVRFLPNPFYIPELKHLTGNDPAVQNYVMQSPLAKEFYQHLRSLLEIALPGYIKEGKSSLTIAIGCTGGQHRSVTIANKLSADLKEKGYKFGGGARGNFYIITRIIVPIKLTEEELKQIKETINSIITVLNGEQ